jgi:hypothetical protein
MLDASGRRSALAVVFSLMSPAFDPTDLLHTKERVSIDRRASLAHLSISGEIATGAAAAQRLYPYRNQPNDPVGLLDLRWSGRAGVKMSLFSFFDPIASDRKMATTLRFSHFERYVLAVSPCRIARPTINAQRARQFCLTTNKAIWSLWFG